MPTVVDIINVSHPSQGVLYTFFKVKTKKRKMEIFEFQHFLSNVLQLII